MISKKLLSEVLNMEIIGSREANVFIMYKVYTPLGVDERGINVYELAHSCKEWAFNKGYKSFLSGTDTANPTIGYFVYIGLGSENEKQFKSDTEPQAIFKACEWIMEQE